MTLFCLQQGPAGLTTAGLTLATLTRVHCMPVTLAIPLLYSNTHTLCTRGSVGLGRFSPSSFHNQLHLNSDVGA